MTTEDPKENQDNGADQRQGGNLETKGASQAPPSARAETSETPEPPSGEDEPSSGE